MAHHLRPGHFKPAKIIGVINDPHGVGVAIGDADLGAVGFGGHRIKIIVSVGVGKQSIFQLSAGLKPLMNFSMSSWPFSTKSPAFSADSSSKDLPAFMGLSFSSEEKTMNGTGSGEWVLIVKG